MRFNALLSIAALVLSVVSSRAEDTAEPNVTAEPDVAVTATFAEANPFGHVVNGERNTLSLSVENKSGRNITLVNVAGSVHHPETHRLIKNLTTTKYGVPLMDGIKIQVPYAFYSEFKPGDLRLNVWLEHSLDDGSKYRVPAYDSVVTIVEPEISIFDFKLISTYLMVAAIFGGLSYLAYLNFVPQKKSRGKKTGAQSVSAPVGTVTASGAGGYQEEWIPEHHLKKAKKASGPSGDELSGSELSGTETRRRKGRK
ncbi:putative signal sequence receptor alpha chain [Lyophyllum shimeji]|uniref:Signal sequence receptor alpha chain n=1 Tax=Lyophyllum shimeji TaxID=47721 RepID=A0A9P3PSF2_LYOSH|nr:putative signal sequence receptor alpha chain [Lyophyllum shimeji]